MLCVSIHAPDDCCWPTLFALWVCGNGFTRLEHDLHVRMHPFQATQYPLARLVLGRLDKNELDKKVALWCAPLSMELMIGADVFQLPCGCVVVD